MTDVVLLTFDLCCSCLIDYSCVQEPKDISYVFTGYAPLSIRLIELFEKPQGWGAFEEVCECVCACMWVCPMSSLTLP